MAANCAGDMDEGAGGRARNYETARAQNSFADGEAASAGASPATGQRARPAQVARRRAGVILKKILIPVPILSRCSCGIKHFRVAKPPF